MMEPSEPADMNSLHSPALHLMCPEMIKHIVQFLDYKGKKMLRGVSSTLKNRVDSCGDKLVHCWRFSTRFSTHQMIKFADEIKTVLGFEVLDATDDGVAYLVKKHPELLMFQLGTNILLPKNDSVSQLTSMGLNPILSIPSLSSFIISQRTYGTNIILENSFKICSTQLQTLNLSGIDGTAFDDVWFLQTLKQIRSTIECLTLANTSISGEILIEFNETLPCLKSLNLSFCKLSNMGLLKILQTCGSTLTSLNVSHTPITGENLADNMVTLPCLKSLNLSFCKLSNMGLLKILQTCGSTLTSLNVTSTHITGENLADNMVTLPCLRFLSIRFCMELSDEGMLKILQICQSTLTSLEVSGTNITGENWANNEGTLPCLENLDLNYCRQLSNMGLLKILQICGSKLVSLALKGTNITGENLADNMVTLPCLRDLSLSCCEELSNMGLLKILQICESTLTFLNVTSTHITGENWADIVTLPCLDTLIIRGCKELSNEGMLKIFQICESTLKILDVTDTNITGENVKLFSHKFDLYINTT